MDGNLPIHKDLFEPVLKHIMDIKLSAETGKAEIVIEIPKNLSLNIDQILTYFEEDDSAIYSRNGKNFMTGTIKSKSLSKWLIENARYA